MRLRNRVIPNLVFNCSTLVRNRNFIDALSQNRRLRIGLWIEIEIDELVPGHLFQLTRYLLWEEDVNCVRLKPLLGAISHGFLFGIE